MLFESLGIKKVRSFFIAVPFANLFYANMTQIPETVIVVGKRFVKYGG